MVQRAQLLDASIHQIDVDAVDFDAAPNAFQQRDAQLTAQVFAEIVQRLLDIQTIKDAVME